MESKFTFEKEGKDLITTYHVGIKLTYLKNNLFNNKVYFVIVDDSSGCGCSSSGGGSSGGSSSSSSGLDGGQLMYLFCQCDEFDFLIVCF
jgi:hypothetical protein